MKSNGYKVIAAIGILGAVAAIGFGVFSLVQGTSAILPSEISALNGPGDQQTITVETFEGSLQSLYVKGVWEGTLRIDPTIEKAKLVLTVPRKFDVSTVWSFNNGQLMLGEVPKTALGKFEIYAPALEKAEFESAGDLNFEKLISKNLTIKFNGIGRIQAEEGKVENLVLEGNWAGELDLEDLTVEDLKLAINVTGKINFGEINKAHGTLSGLGELNFEKITDQKDLKIEGLIEQ